MANLATIYQHIADILSFENSSNALESKLSDSKFNWDDIVVEGSRHLMLPAIYCRLKQKELTHLLPIDLKDYLKEITQLNKDRNLEILDQVYALSNTLNKFQIDHVFLKGSALLVGDYFENIAERMVGDIDILIAEEQLETAFELLTANGYSASAQTFGYDYFEHKHLPRLKTEKFICAVELHKKLFVNYKDKALENPAIRSHKIVKNKVNVPDPNRLMRHNILNYQINDQGRYYNSISFRSAYDSLVIQRKNEFDISQLQTKIFKNYYDILGLFFCDIKANNSKKSLTARFYLFKLKNIGFYRFWNKLLRTLYYLSVVIGRIPKFLISRSYRQTAIKERKRIFQHLRAVLSKS